MAGENVDSYTGTAKAYTEGVCAFVHNIFMFSCFTFTSPIIENSEHNNS